MLNLNLSNEIGLVTNFTKFLINFLLIYLGQMKYAKAQKDAQVIVSLEVDLINSSLLKSSYPQDAKVLHFT